MRSLRSRLALLWILAFAASLAVGGLLVSLYRQSAAAHAGRAEAVAARACELVAERWNFYAAGWAGPAPPAGDTAFRRDLQDLLTFALPPGPPLEAGIWREEEGVLATIGTRPDTLEAAVGANAATALGEDRTITARADTARVGPVGLAVCPLAGPVAGLAAYVAVPLLGAPGPVALQAGLAVLLALMLAMTALLTWLQLAWARHVRGIETALASHEAGHLLHLAPTGERELDRIIAALNTAGIRLAEAQQHSEALASRMALSERLAALGRVAAGVAHEIRNPIAAMRLRAENALAGDDARRRTALEAILAQIARLDRLIGELLAMTQRRTPQPEPVDLLAFLQGCAADHPCVTLQAPANTLVELDPALTRRALDALLTNARQHSLAGAQLWLRASVAAGRLRIDLQDSGPGVDPALRETLFEPFVTGRADGTGLGLSIARELTEAQGGRLVLADPGGDGRGATFALEIPWPVS
jgi:signal transduction histidine kinase